MMFSTLARHSLNHDGKSFIQAWFVGVHTDMGSASSDDGLALYPLQWMMIESQSLGLHLKFEENNNGLYNRAPLDNPLRIVGLEPPSHHEYEWSCTTDNQIIVEMRDIRHRHRDDGYGIVLDKFYNMKTNIWRRPVSESHFERFCDFAPQGTIIYPSVYIVMDLHAGAKKLPYDSQLRAWRSRMIGTTNGLETQGFWNDGKVDADDSDPMRILVCGNSGVGKSTMINKVFGVVATKAS